MLTLIVKKKITQAYVVVTVTMAPGTNVVSTGVTVLTATTVVVDVTVATAVERPVEVAVVC
jgi:hypothetical protein